MWNNLALRNKICIFINYASVFNDVIEIEELIRRIDPAKATQIHSEIEQLESEGLIYTEQGFVTVPNLKFKIKEKEQDFRFTQELLSQRLNTLTKFSLLPTIKFIGVSGSLAAKNPIASDLKPVDIDIFVITSKHSIWLTDLLLKIYHKLADNKTGHFCFNHIWDSTDLEIHNKNFYTATEAYNMIPIYGSLNDFLEANRWIYNYYPTFKLPVRKAKNARRAGLPFVNILFFYLVNVMRCLKNRSLKPLQDLKGKSSNLNTLSITRRGAENGGYQNMVRLRFISNLKRNFPNLKPLVIEQILFPDPLSAKMRSTPNYKLFSRLNKQSQDDWNLNQEKYTSSNFQKSN